MDTFPHTIRAEYLIETAHELEQAAAIMAGEQSSGTFVPIPGETEALRARHAARVERVEMLGEVERPTLPDARPPRSERRPVYRRARVTLAWNYDNVGANLPVLMSTLAGNLYELAPFSALKLLDFEAPAPFAERYAGPAFGITGTRRLCGVEGRPVIGTIIKPSVGLSPAETARQVRTLIEAGLDFIKDDELMGDPPHSPFERRVDEVMAVIERHADRAGRKAMYAFNVSGDMEDMLRRHDYVLQRGGTCVMVSLNAAGLSGVERLRRHSALPIHGHRNGWGMMYRCEGLGMAFPAYQKFWRLAGVDHLHTNGLRNKFCESDESVIRSIKACFTPFFGGYELMPVISSGQWADQALDSYRAAESVDLMYLCGGGITAHPGGLAAGVRSIQLAWEGAVRGQSIQELAPQHPELAAAIAFYGK
jgi:ribulose-bisphosphate carboxylase large chain